MTYEQVITMYSIALEKLATTSPSALEKNFARLRAGKPALDAFGKTIGDPHKTKQTPWREFTRHVRKQLSSGVVFPRP